MTLPRIARSLTMADPLRFTVEVSPDLSRAIAEQGSPIIRAMSLGLVSEMKRLMSLPKTGRSYRRGRFGIHVASAPGEAPAVDNGILTNSINSQMATPTEAIVSINAEYAAYLEYGTRFMRRRPFVEPAIEKVQTQFSGILGQARVGRPRI